MNVKEKITIQKNGEFNFAKFNQIRQLKFHIFESCVDILNFLFAFHYIPGSFKSLITYFLNILKWFFFLNFLIRSNFRPKNLKGCTYLMV